MNDMVPDERIKGPEDELINRRQSEACLPHARRNGSPRSDDLADAFGLDDAEPKNPQRDRRDMGLTRERVRQIESEAMLMLAKGILGE